MLSTYNYSIEATSTKKSLGRIVNDSPIHYVNARMKWIVINKQVRVYLFSIRNFSKGNKIRHIVFLFT